jgi:hypothetical protein
VELSSILEPGIGAAESTGSHAGLPLRVLCPGVEIEERAGVRAYSIHTVFTLTNSRMPKAASSRP